MKRIFLIALLIFVMIFSAGAAKKSSSSNLNPDEIKRMGIFLSNFTEVGLFKFNLENGDDEDMLYFGDSNNMDELICFGIGHNIINNKKLIGKCTRKNCEYGSEIISAKAVADSVRKYFDLPVKHQSIIDGETRDYPPFVEYDGKSYHFNKNDWLTDTTYYADVQEVEKNDGIITMKGELYDINDKSERPATFTATAKPYNWNKKDTWSILSLNVEWR